ncbi:unnamed protein product [Caenorhabditis brenneri]
MVYLDDCCSGCWINLHFLVWAIGCITQNFQLTGPNWSYDMTVKYAELFANLELVLCFPTLILSFCSYILIIYSIYKKRRISQLESSSSFRTEVGVLIQATILTTYMAVLITLWHNAEVFEVEFSSRSATHFRLDDHRDKGFYNMSAQSP